MLVTFDPRNNQLVLQRVGGFRVRQPVPAALGLATTRSSALFGEVMGQGKLDQLEAHESDVKAVPALAISLEPKGGVPSETGPTGPVLFKGALIRRDL